jgi:hypothetical protein
MTSSNIPAATDFIREIINEDMGNSTYQGRQGLRLRSERRANARDSRHLDHAGQKQPLSQPVNRRKPKSI